MSRTLQVRGVPEDVHAAVRVRAAEAGLSISDYLGRLITEAVTTPTMAQVIERARTLAASGGGTTKQDAVAAVRVGRDR